MNKPILSLFDPDNWREIGHALARNKTRTFLTAFGIFWGTAMLAMLMGGASGLKGVLYRNFSGFATNCGAIEPGQRTISYMGFNKGSWWELTMEDAEVIRAAAPAIDALTTVDINGVTAAYGMQSTSARAMGVESSYSRIQNPVIENGRFINQSDDEKTRKVAVIGRNVAKTLFDSKNPVGERVSLNGVYFTIIGVASQTGEASIGGRIDDNFILPASTHRQVFNRGNKIGFIVFTAPSGHRPSDNETSIRRILSRRHSIHPDDENAVGMMDISEMFEMVDNIFMGVSLLALFVGLGSLMAGVVGVGNIMWIIVKERTHEFGVRRAIGAKPLDITMQVLSESIVLTLVAGAAGVCFAALILGIADKLTYDPVLGNAGFEIPFGMAVGIILTFFVLGSAAGTLPAIKAMRIKPIEALQDK